VSPDGKSIYYTKGERSGALWKMPVSGGEESQVLPIDGESHREKFLRDQIRQKNLESLGLNVLRFHDRDVKRDMANVLRCIQNWIDQTYEGKQPDIPLRPLQRGNSSSVACDGASR
jgi:uncharacterized protein DUF559